jgi:general secretion pathway protein B
MVRPLAGEAAGPELVAAAPVTPTAPAGEDSGTLPQAPAPAASVPRGLGAVQSIDELPADFRQSLPRLHMDVHGYATKPADRFVVINLKQYRIGDTLVDGPVLKDIVPQGAVLEFRGVTFLLPPS